MPFKIITQKDIVRVVAQKPDNTSLAAAYFKSRPMHPSTMISATQIKKEIGNIPVVGRGGPGIRPKHGLDTRPIEPMPIEIDDVVTAKQMDEYDRADDMGKQQITDEYTSEHYDMVRETMNALCCQAHRGKIDYMMKTETGLVRYVVDYGTVSTVQLGRLLSKLTVAQAIQDLSKLAQRPKQKGVGGPVEFVVASDVYSTYVELLTKANQQNMINDEYLLMGKFKVYEDNDSYIDIVNGTRVQKSLCNPGEICCRVINAGQSMPFCKLDDTVQQSTVAFYTFSKDRDDQRGTNIYSKSKPFPLVNVNGIVFGQYTLAKYAVTFSAGANGTLTAKVDDAVITSGTAVENGKVVIFTVTPGDGYVLDAWGGADAADIIANDDGTYALSVDEVKTLSVTFKAA